MKITAQLRLLKKGYLYPSSQLGFILWLSKDVFLSILFILTVALNSFLYQILLSFLTSRNRCVLRCFFVEIFIPFIKIRNCMYWIFVLIEKIVLYWKKNEILFKFFPFTSHQTQSGEASKHSWQVSWFSQTSWELTNAARRNNFIPSYTKYNLIIIENFNF